MKTCIPKAVKGLTSEDGFARYDFRQAKVCEGATEPGAEKIGPGSSALFLVQKYKRTLIT